MPGQNRDAVVHSSSHDHCVLRSGGTQLPYWGPGDSRNSKICSVALIWVTGVSGSGKSSVCEALRTRDHLAVDADWDGFSQWVHRLTAEPVVDPPYPVPPGWLNNFAWRVKPEAVESLAANLGSGVGFLCGGFENEDDVWHFFDRVVCLVVDEGTLRDRLATRTANQFGKHPDQLRAALRWRLVVQERFRTRGAVQIDATQPLEVVVAEVVASVEKPRW